MKPPLPRIASAVPQTLHAQLEIAKAIRAFAGPGEDELLRQRRTEIAALRRDLEALARDIPKTFAEVAALALAELGVALRRNNAGLRRPPCAKPASGRWEAHAKDTFQKASSDDREHPGWPAGTPGGRGGKFRPKDGATSGTSSALEPIPVVDFSAGFHEAVVNHWMGYLKSLGIPAIKEPAVRLIGQPDVVYGYPDIIAIMPGTGPSVLEVKTGNEPITLTANQTVYLPMMQLGWHIYSDDARVSELGWEPGVPFPPLRVFFIRAPGPGEDYSVAELPPPKILRGSKSAP